MLHNRALVALTAVFGTCTAAVGQCLPEWSAMPRPYAGGRGFTILDQDGPGPGLPRLVIGGGANSLTSEPLGIIKQWDGRRWLPLGVGLTGWQVNAVCVAETSGVGSPQPGLYATGIFVEAGGSPAQNIARWDGSDWHPLAGGVQGGGFSLLMFDEDGEGPGEAQLFIGGTFGDVGAFYKPGLVRWDGQDYSLVGGGLEPWNPVVNVKVKALTIFDDDGPGPRKPALYVGGSFSTAGGVAVNQIARWDGETWESLQSGLSGTVQALAVFDPDGTGPELPKLYVGGQFSAIGAQGTDYFARWDGQEWRGVPGYEGGAVKSLIVHDDDGDGPNKESLFVGGHFYSVNGMPAYGIARWDGQRWYDLDLGLFGLDPSIGAMGIFDEDGDPATPPGLYAGGVAFFTAGSAQIYTPGLARWGCPLSICYADCEASTGFGTLDLFDFLCFQNSFVNGEPYACDCDTTTGPLVCDLFDFLCFQDAFVGGCP